jgi:ABC-type Na+ efflux pump permease subunit
MTFLPIVERELRVAARRRVTYWKRQVPAAAALGVGAWVMLTDQTAAQVGPKLFSVLAVGALIFSLFLGVSSTADCLSEEKRENTLGLLFLTDLKGYDLVLGKLAATALHALYGLLAIFPVLAIPLLTGGVSGAEFARVLLVCANNMLFSLAVGMFCSALCRDDRRAAGLGSGLVLTLAVLWPLLMILIADSRNTRPAPWLLLPSPGFTAFFAFDAVRSTPAAFPRYAAYFPYSVVCVQGLAWVLLALAAVILPRSWQDKTENARVSWWRSRWRRLAYGTQARRDRARAQMLEINPIFWLTGRDRTKSGLVWFFLGIMGAFWAYGLWRDPEIWLGEVPFVLTALTVHTVFKFWVASEACRRLAADRHSGALELLLATPLPVARILTGQLLALWKQFAGPVALVLLADFAFLLGGRAHNNESWRLVWLAGIGMLLADMFTLSWLGMWMGLRRRNANRAAAAALWRVLVLPWIVFLGYSGLAELAGRLVLEERTRILAWLTIGVGLDLYYGLRSRASLLGEFRRLAAERYERRAGLWASRRVRNLP